MNRDVCGICWCPYDEAGACGCKPLDDAMRLPHAMAQAYEAGYKAGVAHEREACAKVCEDLWKINAAATECAAAIRAQGVQS